MIKGVSKFVIPEGVNLVFCTKIGLTYSLSIETYDLIHDYFLGEDYKFEKVFNININENKGKIFSTNDGDKSFINKDFLDTLDLCNNLIGGNRYLDLIETFSDYPAMRKKFIKDYEKYKQEQKIFLYCGNNNLSINDMYISFVKSDEWNVKLRNQIHGVRCDSDDTNEDDIGYQDLENKECKLSELVNIFGTGTYFLLICRPIENMDNLTPLELETIGGLENVVELNSNLNVYQGKCFEIGCKENYTKTCICGYRYCEKHIIDRREREGIMGHNCSHVCENENCLNDDFDENGKIKYRCTHCLYCDKRICKKCLFSKKSNHRQKNCEIYKNYNTNTIENQDIIDSSIFNILQSNSLYSYIKKKFSSKINKLNNSNDYYEEEVTIEYEELSEKIHLFRKLMNLHKTTLDTENLKKIIIEEGTKLFFELFNYIKDSIHDDLKIIPNIV